MQSPKNSRRSLLRTAAGLAALPPGRGAAHESPNSITDVAGLRVGHFTDGRRPTGCTVVLFDKGAIAGVDVRGAAPSP